MLRIVTIVGARPQFIKAACVSRAIEKYNVSVGANDKIKEIIIHTGQHYDANMSNVFFHELNLREPNFNLGVGSGSHGVQTGRMLQKIENVLLEADPHLVLTYGDTNSTLAGALAASKLRILCAHVEAGLRSYNRSMPEEINRIVADKVSNLLFCPTESAVRNLEKEGIVGGRKSENKGVAVDDQLVFVTGDVMYDAVLFNRDLASSKSRILEELDLASASTDVVCPYCVATVHRQENTDDYKKLDSILEGLARIANMGINVVLPLHPRTRERIVKFELDRKYHLDLAKGNRKRWLRIIEPVSYLDMLQLEQNALCIFTDSGGVQKEAFFLKVPCITLRMETEWIETVESGWNVLVGYHPEKVEEAFMEVLKWENVNAPFMRLVEGGEKLGRTDDKKIFGDGRAAGRIVDILVSMLI